MGGDGGFIPNREDLVKTKKRPEQRDKDSERLFHWQHCHLTQEPLRRPIVACQLGRLYNKQAVIERLLDRGAEAKSNTNFDHIKSLKDLKELDLTPNPSFRAQNPSVGDGRSYVDRLVSPWICPIIGLEMNGRFKFVLDWSSGKVLSERAHKILSGDNDGKIQDEDLVVLNPTDEDVDLVRVKMEARRAKEKSEKKRTKKRKSDTSSTLTSDPFPNKRAKSATKVPPSDACIAKQSNVTKTPIRIQEDPTKSEVYKSIFSLHSSAQNKPSGHWVTFDPRYYN